MYISDIVISEGGTAIGAYLGVDIGGTSVKWALVDDNFNMIDRGDTPTAFSSSEEVVRAICDIAQTHAGAFAAVGVSAPGLIFEEDPDGTIYHGGALTYMQCVLDPDVFAIAGGISCHDVLIEAIEEALVNSARRIRARSTPCPSPASPARRSKTTPTSTAPCRRPASCWDSRLSTRERHLES